MKEAVVTNIKGLKRREGFKFKGMIIGECVTANLNGFEFWTVRDLKARVLFSGVRFIAIGFIIPMKTTPSNHHTLQFTQSIQLE